MWIANIDLFKEMVHRPEVVDRLPTMHHYNQSALTADEVYEELEEGVDGEGFVEVADGIRVEGCLYGDETDPRGDGVDGDHEEDADYVALEEGFAVVLARYMLVGLGFIA